MSPSKWIWWPLIFPGAHQNFEIPHLDTLYWRHNDHDGVSNHQPHGCLLSRLFRRRSKKTSKLRVNTLCGENVSIWWRHHDLGIFTAQPIIFMCWDHNGFKPKNHFYHPNWNTSHKYRFFFHLTSYSVACLWLRHPHKCLYLSITTT